MEVGLVFGSFLTAIYAVRLGYGHYS
jgi:hypothetical protein